MVETPLVTFYGIRSHDRPSRIVKAIDMLMDIVGIEAEIGVFVSEDLLGFRSLGSRAQDFKVWEVGRSREHET